MKKSMFAVICLLMLVVPAAMANTLLTNGVPLTFTLPIATVAGSFYGGDFGYAVYVPPGAISLTIDIDVEVHFGVDVLVRLNSGVGFSGLGALRFDYGARGGIGPKHLVINQQSNPPLQTGTYYIDFLVNTVGAREFITLTATVEGGSIPPIRTVGLSTFDNDLDGWVRNSAASPLPGASQGDDAATLVWQTQGGNPGGFARLFDAGGGASNMLVAPAKFLGDLSTLVEPRFEFDYMEVTGADPVYPVEIRIFGSGTAFSWLGSIPPQVAVNFDPCARLVLNSNNGKYECASAANTWTHFTASLQRQLWTRLEGTASFAQVLANVQRIEVLTDLTFYAESGALDNFALRSRGVQPTEVVLPGNTSFASGADGWTRNYPASDLAGASAGAAPSNFRWNVFEGNPTGHVLISSAAGTNGDAFLAPLRFLGNYQSVPNPQFEFDYLFLSVGEATRPVEVRLFGAQSAFVWTGTIPTSTWTHYVAPLTDALWKRASGNATLALALANVERIEVSADQSDSPESDALDNFWLMPGSLTPAPPALSANPVTLSFAAMARGTNPTPQEIGVTSIGGGVPLTFSVSSSANWLKVSSGSGTTPRTLKVSADVNGLPEGAYTGVVIVAAPGTTLAPQRVAVSLMVAARPGPRPRLNTGGAVNAANNRTQLAPGALGTLYGSGLGPAAGIIASFVPGFSILPTRLQGVRLLVNETYGALIAEAPLLYVSESQINFQLPFETIGHPEVALVVDNNGNPSERLLVQVTHTAPGIFTYGDNRAVAVNEDNSVNAADNGAIRGSVLTIYMTGQGTVTPTLPTGAAAPGRPLVRAPFPAQVSFGGVPAQVLFVGLTPGLVGVLQVNAVVPQSAPSGDSALTVNIGGWISNAPLITVR